MNYQDSQYFSTQFLRNYLVIKAPFRTGNLALNGIGTVQKVGLVTGATYEIAIGGEIAPYVVYTNEKWVAEKWNGATNPNENWIQRAIDEAKPTMIQILKSMIDEKGIQELLRSQGQVIDQRIDMRKQMLIEQAKKQGYL
jgi:hypothetical protein